MNTRNITRDDLPMLAELVGCPELTEREDISFEHSTMAVDEDGEVVAFIVLRQRSLQDFFGGEIPDGYIRGGQVETWMREDMHRYSQEQQFEMICSYQREHEEEYFETPVYDMFMDLVYECWFTVWVQNTCSFIAKELRKTLIDFNGVISFYNVD